MGLFDCFRTRSSTSSIVPVSFHDEPRKQADCAQPLAERKQLDLPAAGPGLLSSTEASSVDHRPLGGVHVDYGRSRRKSMEQSGDVLNATLELARQRRMSSNYEASTSGQNSKSLWSWLGKGKQAPLLPEPGLQPKAIPRQRDGSGTTAEVLQRRGFPVHYAKDIHKSVSTSTTKPIAVLGLEPASDGSDGVGLDQPVRSSDGSPESLARRNHNKLFPLYVNGVAKTYFKISASRDYAQVLRRLLRRDPLLTFALQKAIRSLSMGDCKPVSHVTSDPTGASASLYGLRITPCVWSDTNGHKIPALLLEHNVPYESQDVMPRLLRDYAVLSHVPSILTLIDFNGHVLYQNAASIDYCGDLTSHNVETGDGMMGVLFQYESHMLQEMLQEVNEGNYWQQVVRVPASLKRHMIFEAEAAWGYGSRQRGKKLTAAVSKRFIQDALEPEFQLESFTTQNARSQRTTNRRVTPVFQTQPSMARQESAARGRGGPLRQDTRDGVAISGPASLPVGRLSSITGAAPRLGSQTLGPNGHVVFNLPNQLEESQGSNPAPHGGSFSTGVSKASAPTQHSHLTNPGQNRRFMTLMQSAAAQNQQPSFTASMNSFHTDGDKPDSRGAAQGSALQEECWHDISAIPLLDPVLDKQVILLLQTNVTARVELENRLADLTDAQLGMLEQLFPRHVIEYMLSHKHGYNSRNLTHLANHHDDVIVLFTDVVGFTSMSKEVEPSEVMHFLNELYTVFDDLVDLHDLYKLDTVGDCYIVVAGLTMQDDDGFTCTVQGDNEQRLQHAQVMMDFAKAILRESKQVLMPHNQMPVQIRIGIHLGSLASGLVGPKMPKFTLFGDTMNTASRMESTCRPGCVQVSEAFASLLPLEDWADTGGVEVKGKGHMQTFLWMPKPEDLIPLGAAPRPALAGGEERLSLDGGRHGGMAGGAATAPDDSAADRTDLDGATRISGGRPKSSRPYRPKSSRPKSSRFARTTAATGRGDDSRPSTASSHGGLARGTSMALGRSMSFGRSLSRRNMSFKHRPGDSSDEDEDGLESTPFMAILHAIRASGTGEGEGQEGPQPLRSQPNSLTNTARRISGSVPSGGVDTDEVQRISPQTGAAASAVRSGAGCSLVGGSSHSAQQGAGPMMRVSFNGVSGNGGQGPLSGTSARSSLGSSRISITPPAGGLSTTPSGSGRATSSGGLVVDGGRSSLGGTTNGRAVLPNQSSPTVEALEEALDGLKPSLKVQSSLKVESSLKARSRDEGSKPLKAVRLALHPDMVEEGIRVSSSGMRGASNG